jgi:enoyl-CoA hydratase/carnithine racemase
VHNEGVKGSTRALILTSESDDAFCAGADLKERLTFTEAEYACYQCPRPFRPFRPTYVYRTDN